MNDGDQRSYDPPLLKPCPFCGEEADDSVLRARAEPFIWIQCGNENCCAEGPSMSSAYTAIAAWNKRHE